MILVYPVISFQESIGHMGSRDQLIGKAPTKEKTDYYSNELQLNEKTPQSLLIHSSDDDGVKPDNSILFYQALIRNKVPARVAHLSKWRSWLWHVHENIGRLVDGSLPPLDGNRWLAKIAGLYISTNFRPDGVSKRRSSLDQA